MRKSALLPFLTGANMQYAEIYADADGISHVRDCSVSFTDRQVAPPALPFGTSDPMTADSAAFLSIPAGWAGGWHPPPADGFIVVLRGQVQIEVGDGEIRQFSAGSVLRHRDRVGRGHDSRVIGDETVLLVIINLPD